MTFNQKRDRRPEKRLAHAPRGEKEQWSHGNVDVQMVDPHVYLSPYFSHLLVTKRRRLHLSEVKQGPV